MPTAFAGERRGFNNQHPNKGNRLGLAPNLEFKWYRVSPNFWWGAKSK